MSKVNYRPHKKNLRLDLTLYNLGFTESRAKAIDLIKQGKVFVNSKIVKKNSYLVISRNIKFKNYNFFYRILNEIYIFILHKFYVSGRANNK